MILFDDADLEAEEKKLEKKEKAGSQCRNTFCY